jgi:hypothetical protein
MLTRTQKFQAGCVLVAVGACSVDDRNPELGDQPTQSVERAQPSAQPVAAPRPSATTPSATSATTPSATSTNPTTAATQPPSTQAVGTQPSPVTPPPSTQPPSGTAMTSSAPPPPTLNPELLVGYNVAFVTSQLYTPGSMPAPGSAANQECARLASAAGLPGSRYIAWLGAEGASSAVSDDITPLTSFRSTGGFLRTDGAPVARTFAAFARGELLHPLTLDEHAQPGPPSSVWSGMLALDGSLVRLTENQVFDCNDWSQPSPSQFGGIIVRGSVGTSFFSLPSSQPCSQAAPMYCFGDDSSAEVAVLTPSPSRLAFLSGTDFTPGGGLATADAICQRDACVSGLTGSSSCATDLGSARTFKSYLHTTTQPAWQRFDLTGPTWARPDGVPWLATAADLSSDGSLALTATNVTLALEYLAGNRSLWVGSSDGSGTCADWTSTTGLGNLSVYDISIGSSLSQGGNPSICSTPGRILCLEE